MHLRRLHDLFISEALGLLHIRCEYIYLVSMSCSVYSSASKASAAFISSCRRTKAKPPLQDTVKANRLGY